MPSIRRWRTLALLAALSMGLAWHMLAGRDRGVDRELYGAIDIHAPGPRWSKLPDRFPAPTPLATLPGSGSGSGSAATAAGQSKHENEVGASSTAGKKEGVAEETQRRIGRIQHGRKRPADEDPAARKTRLRRLAKVEAAFKHSWQGYKRRAWLRDELLPVTGDWTNPFGGWAATLVDSLDALWIMGWTDEFEHAVEATKKIDFTTTNLQQINVFETTIRYLGGFLSAYELSGGKYEVLLTKAKEVGELLICAFDTPNRMPIPRWYWQSYVDGAEQVSTKNMLVSELGSLSLEFTKLSQLTGDMRFYDAVQRIANELEKAQSKTRLPGMWPIVVDARNLTFDMDNSFTLGGMSDSAYEYLPKQYLLLGGRLEQPRRLYEAFLPVAKRHLFRRAMNEHNRTIVLSGDARVVGELSDPSVISTPQMQHLTCFVGGMVALAARALDRGQDEIELARALTDGCVWSYEATSSGVGPETFNYIACADIDDPDADAKCAWDEMRWRRAVGARWKPFAKAVPGEVHRRNDAPTPTVEDGGAGNNGTDGNAQHAPAATDDEISRIIKTKRLPPGMTNVPGPEYLLRPEAIESVFIMHRVTGEPEWMEKAWRMFERVEATTRTKWAAAALNDVTRPNPSHINNMQSFWLTETLKYFYLVFADWDVVDLDEWVLNTEAHPFRRADAMG